MTRGRLRWAALPAFAGLLAMGALLWFTAVGLAKPTVTNVPATLVDATDHNATVRRLAARGGAWELRLDQGDRDADDDAGGVASTSYAFGNASPTCVNTADHNTMSTFTEYVDVTLPETTPTPGSVRCSSTPRAAARLPRLN